MCISSSIAASFTKQAILEFIYSDTYLKSEYEKLNKRIVQPSACPLDKDEIPTYNLEKITEYANKILALIQYHAANDQSNVKIKADERNLPRSIHSFPHLKESLLGQSSVTQIITQLFAKKFQITIEAKSNEWEITWSKSNSQLGFKPAYKSICSLHQSQKEFFISLLKDSPFSDIAFLVEDKAIKAHKVFLSQSPFFKKMFLGEWKEKNSSEPIGIPNFSHQAFMAMLYFFYSIGIDKSYFKDPAQMVELFKLADYVESEPLKEYCRKQIHKRINSENFIDVALMLEQYQDENLVELCRWYIKKDPTFGENVDLSTFHPLHLIYKIGKRYEARELEKNCLKQLKESLKLDEKFVPLCEFIATSKDSILKEWLLTHLRASSLYKELYENRKDEKYQKQWKAFKVLLQDISY